MPPTFACWPLAEAEFGTRELTLSYLRDDLSQPGRPIRIIDPKHLVPFLNFAISVPSWVVEHLISHELAMHSLGALIVFL